jgi:tripartite-type tricarboxylate transporter receptor subunit TctC
VQAPGILVAHPAFPPSTLKELIDYAKATRQGHVRIVGRGKLQPPLGPLFRGAGGREDDARSLQGRRPAHHRPARRATSNIVFGTLPLFEQHVKSGKMKALAVLAKERIPQLPNVPIAGECSRLRGEDLVRAARARGHAEGRRRSACSGTSERR